MQQSNNNVDNQKPLVVQLVEPAEPKPTEVDLSVDLSGAISALDFNDDTPQLSPIEGDEETTLVFQDEQKGGLKIV